MICIVPYHVVYFFFTVCTIGIRVFVECSALCRLLFVGHSAKKPLPSVELGKVLLSANVVVTESRTLGTEIHSAKISLSSATHSTKGDSRQRPSAAVKS
jgi:hypothetical protein